MKNIILLLLFTSASFAQNTNYSLVVKFKRGYFFDTQPVSYIVDGKVYKRSIFKLDSSYNSVSNKIFKSANNKKISNQIQKQIAVNLHKLEQCLKLDTMLCNQNRTNIAFQNSTNSGLILKLYYKNFNLKKLQNLLLFFKISSCNKECLKVYSIVFKNLPIIENVTVESTGSNFGNTNKSENKMNSVAAFDYFSAMNINALHSQTGGKGERGKLFILEDFSSPSKHDCKYDSPSISVSIGNIYHATSVYGILKAKITSDCCPEVKGIIPNADVTSRFFNHSIDSGDDDDDNDLLAALISDADVGDVILLEFHKQVSTVATTYSDLPPEASPELSELISGAVGIGIIIVEGAGNSFLPLTGTASSVGGFLHTDTGAIIVGGVLTNFASHTAYTYLLGGDEISRVADVDCISLTDAKSNYGNKVDCYAFGENIATVKDGTSCCLFGGTSSASAIVAGMAVSLQSIYRNLHDDANILPRNLRNLFRRGGNINVFRWGSSGRPTVKPASSNRFVADGQILFNGISSPR